MFTKQSFLGCPCPCLVTVMDDPVRQTLQNLGNVIDLRMEYKWLFNDVRYDWIETGKTALDTPTMIPCNAIWEVWAKKAAESFTTSELLGARQWR